MRARALRSPTRLADDFTVFSVGEVSVQTDISFTYLSAVRVEKSRTAVDPSMLSLEIVSFSVVGAVTQR